MSDLKEALGLNSVSRLVTFVSIASKSIRIDARALVRSKNVTGLGFASSSESIACYLPSFFFFFSEPELLPLPLDFELPLSEPLSLFESEPLPEPEPLPSSELLSEPLPLSSSLLEAASLSENHISQLKLKIYLYRTSWCELI